MQHVRTWLICLLLALTGCATTIETAPPRLEMQQPKALDMVQESDRQASATQAPMQTMFDVEPVEDNVLATILEGFQSAEWLPYENGRAPPVNVAQVTTNPIVTGICPPEFQGPTGVTGRVGNCEMPSFVAALQSSLVPGIAQGSPTPTFTAASTRYQTDFEGKQNLVLSGEARFQGARRVENITVNSETLTAAAGWVLSNATSVVGATDPNGGVSAYTLTATGVNGYILDSYASAIGNTHTTAIFIKRLVGTGTIKYIVAAGTDLDITASVSSSWARIGNVSTIGSGFAYHGIKLATSGDAVAIWHPQSEFVTGQTNQNPSEYVSVGVLSAPYHGANVDGVKYFSTLNGNTVASNVVTEATGAAINSSAGAAANGVALGVVDASGPYGYLAEGARADVLGTTAAIRRTMTDAGWVNGGTLTVGAATGVDGVASAAASLTGGAVTATNTVLFTTVLGAAVRTYSAWVRRKTGTGTVEMTKDGGVSWTDITTSVTSAYRQVQVVTASAANPVVGFRITTNTDAIEVDFNTLEAATFANPTPIPINVSKAADALTFVSAGNLITLSPYSIYFDAMTVSNTTVQTAIASNGNYRPFFRVVGTTANKPEAWSDTAGGAGNALGASQITANAVHKFIMSKDSTNVNIAVDGVLGTPAAFGTQGAEITTIDIGLSVPAGFPLFGSIRNLRIYPVALPTASMRRITSDASDWLGRAYRMAANDGHYRLASNQ